MPFGSNDAQASQRFHLFVVLLPLAALLLQQTRLGLWRYRLIGFDGVQGFFEVAAQHDVGSTPRHIGGDRDHLGPPRLRHDIGLFGMLLGIENLVRQLLPLQQLRDDFRVFNRCGANQDRLAPFKTLADVLNSRFVFLRRGFVNAVQLILATARPVWRHHHGFEAVDFLEFVGFGVSGSRHSGQLAIQAEVVLEGDGGQCLVFSLDLHTLFGFNRLMQTVAPAAARHEPPGEFVDDDDLASLHHVMLVFVIEVLSPQRSIQMMHQRDVGRVVQGGTFGDQPHAKQNAFGVFMALFGQENLMAFFVNREIARLGDTFAGARISFALLADKLGHHLLDCHIQAGMVVRLAADDERRTGFINQD